MPKPKCACGRINPGLIWLRDEPYICEQCREIVALRTRAEKAEAERLRVQVERLEGRVDEPCDGCTEKALEAVREIVDHFDCTNPERDRDKIRDALDGKGE